MKRIWEFSLNGYEWPFGRDAPKKQFRMAKSVRKKNLKTARLSWTRAILPDFFCKRLAAGETDHRINRDHTLSHPRRMLYFYYLSLARYIIRHLFSAEVALCNIVMFELGTCPSF